MKRLSTILEICIFLILSVNAYAGTVKITNVKDNQGGKYVVIEKLEEGAKFFHDRQYTIVNIPKKYLGLTWIQGPCDIPGGPAGNAPKYELEFEIDRAAWVYIAWDSREGAGAPNQFPKGWLSKSYTYTKDDVTLGAPHPPTPFNVYKSNKPFPKGKVTLYGFAKNNTMFTVFVEEAKGADVSHAGGFVTTWGGIKIY